VESKTARRPVSGLRFAAGLLGFVFWLASASHTAAQTISAQEAIIPVERIWDRADHNAFTDLIRFKGRLYCTFREGSAHVHGLDGKIRVIASKDGQNWESVALLAEDQVDLRDPKLSETPDGRLMVSMGGSFYRNKKLLKREPRVSFSNEEGNTFSSPTPVVLDKDIRTGYDWLWRVTWHEGVGYGVVYQTVEPEWQVQLVSTKDGTHYDHVATLDVDGKPGETTLRFMPDGRIVALMRREGEDRRGFFGTSAPPYTDWSWSRLKIRLGGPNFICLPNGRFLAGTRGGYENRKYCTSLVWLTRGGGVSPIFTLPSSGDTSYPGFVPDDDKLLVSYYSSHEDKTSIYLATIRLDALLNREAATITLNQKDTGYRGIWYMNQPSGDEYVYKYSGGLGTYCAKHKPFAVYCEKVDKTFFCYGGTTTDSNRQLLHMVSYFDHKTETVPRPTVLLDKKTGDAHDNPVIAVDDRGFIWVFSTSHGTSRPSYIHRSKRPYDIDEFELVQATRMDRGKRVPITNFSYVQAWHVPNRGFICFFTRYGYPAARTICCMTSADGIEWSEWQRLAAIDQGHYQISAVGRARAGSAFNYHPEGKGLNWRTNLYYVETRDFGKTWHTVDGRPLELPLTEMDNAALVHDYRSEGLNVYLKDIRYDEHDRPVILYLTSGGYEAGPKNDPRTWTIARWTGNEWDRRPVTVSDNNYDMGSLSLGDDGTWRIIAPTETGPQPYNPGGEMAMWASTDQGRGWKKVKQLTAGSERNHTYARRPVNAHPGFYAIWADGHGRKPSESNLYFCNRAGDVYILPSEMEDEFVQPPHR